MDIRAIFSIILFGFGCGYPFDPANQSQLRYECGGAGCTPGHPEGDLGHVADADQARVDADHQAILEAQANHRTAFYASYYDFIRDWNPHPEKFGIGLEGDPKSTEYWDRYMRGMHDFMKREGNRSDGNGGSAYATDIAQELEFAILSREAAKGNQVLFSNLEVKIVDKELVEHKLDVTSTFSLLTTFLVTEGLGSLTVKPELKHESKDSLSVTKTHRGMRVTITMIVRTPYGEPVTVPTEFNLAGNDFASGKLAGDGVDFLQDDRDGPGFLQDLKNLGLAAESGGPVRQDMREIGTSGTVFKFQLSEVDDTYHLLGEQAEQAFVFLDTEYVLERGNYVKSSVKSRQILTAMIEKIKAEHAESSSRSQEARDLAAKEVVTAAEARIAQQILQPLYRDSCALVGIGPAIAKMKALVANGAGLAKKFHEQSVAVKTFVNIESFANEADAITSEQALAEQVLAEALRLEAIESETCASVKNLFLAIGLVLEKSAARAADLQLKKLLDDVRSQMRQDYEFAAIEVWREEPYNTAELLDIKVQKAINENRLASGEDTMDEIAAEGEHLRSAGTGIYGAEAEKILAYLDEIRSRWQRFVERVEPARILRQRGGMLQAQLNTVRSIGERFGPRDRDKYIELWVTTLAGRNLSWSPACFEKALATTVNCWTINRPELITPLEMREFDRKHDVFEEALNAFFQALAPVSGAE